MGVERTADQSKACVLKTLQPHALANRYKRYKIDGTHRSLFRSRLPLASGPPSSVQPKAENGTTSTVFVRRVVGVGGVLVRCQAVRIADVKKRSIDGRAELEIG